MLFSIDRDTLKDALGALQKVAQARNAPLFGVSGNVLIEASSHEVIISATDLEIGVRIYLSAKVSKQGAICLPVDVLMNVVSALPAESTIQVKHNTRTRMAALECASNKTNLKGSSAEEFPALPTFEQYPIAIPASEMRWLIACTVFAADQSNQRPILTGVKFQLTGNGLTMAAADGFRLAVVHSANITGDLSAVIPARALSALDKGLAALAAQEDADEDIPVQIAYDPATARIGFRVAGLYEMIATQVEGTFPDYEQIIPRKFETYATVDTAQLRQALALQKPFAKDSAWATRVTATDGRMNISSTSQEKGDADSQLEAQVEGDPIDISFNLTYLSSAIAVIQTEEVMFKFVSGSAPTVIVPREREDFTYVIMPMSGERPRPTEKQENLTAQPDEPEEEVTEEAVEA